MSADQKKTAILIFAQSAEKDAAQKSFGPSTQLFEALNLETLRKVQQSSIPYFHFSDKEQTGDSFGERFVNAVQAIYDKGFDKVITIGNDSPQLKTTHLLEAEMRLNEGKTVLGPTLDGGFYLMGLHKNNFDSTLFLRLPWQRFGLFNQISTLLGTNNSSIHLLPVLQDIDNQKDITSLLNFTQSITKFLMRVFSSLLIKIKAPIPKKALKHESLLSFSLFNKGSPYFFSLA